MSIDNLIAEIDAEITRLQQAHALLSGATSPAAKKRGRPAKTAGAARVVKAVAAGKPVKKRRKLSPEGRARIAAAAKARWAKVAAQKKAAAKAPTKASAKAPAKAAATPAKKAPTKKAPAKKVVAKKAPAKAVEPVESSSSNRK